VSQAVLYLEDEKGFQMKHFCSQSNFFHFYRIYRIYQKKIEKLRIYIEFVKEKKIHEKWTLMLTHAVSKAVFLSVITQCMQYLKITVLLLLLLLLLLNVIKSMRHQLCQKCPNIHDFNN
jgi:hypothetical protein